MLLEIACFNFDSAMIAASAGAGRIELCENYEEGGVTPDFDLIAKVKLFLKIPVRVMIRPRGGDFIYSMGEFEKMKVDIEACKVRMVDGIVLGMLTPEGTIDVERCKELVNISKPMPVTFHRAFDHVKDPFQSLVDVSEIGCDRLLTSGQKKTAVEGIELITELVERAKGRIIIMPGGNIRSENISTVLKTNAMEFHTSALAKNGLLADADEIRKIKIKLLSKTL